VDDALSDDPLREELLLDEPLRDESS